MRDHDGIFRLVDADVRDVRGFGGERGERLRGERGGVRRAVHHAEERGICEPAQGFTQGLRQALLGIGDERTALLGSREPVDDLPHAARLLRVRKAPMDARGLRRRGHVHLFMDAVVWAEIPRLLHLRRISVARRRRWVVPGPLRGRRRFSVHVTKHRSRPSAKVATRDPNKRARRSATRPTTLVGRKGRRKG